MLAGHIPKSEPVVSDIQVVSLQTFLHSAGQWSHFNDTKYTAHSVQLSGPNIAKYQACGVFCVGDVEGVVTMGAFPCLDQTTTRTYRYLYLQFDLSSKNVERL